MLLLVLAVVALRQPLVEHLWPQTRAQQLLDQAHAALGQQHLTAADGSGARELYEAALALDPDRGEARAGLARVGQAALAQARTALAQGRFGDAHRALRLARELDVPREGVQAVAESLRAAEARQAGVGGLLASASRARAEGRLDGAPDAALPLFARVLALEPANVLALEGREDALADLLQQARATLQRGELDAAADMVRRARGHDRGHVDLPETQELLVDAAQARRRQADEQLEYGRLDAALDGYRTALLANPDDDAAVQGIERVALAWVRRAERHARDFQFAPAAAALRRAQEIAPDLAAVRAAEAHLQQSRRAHARIGPQLAPAERNRRVQALLAQAAQAQARGDLITPPGESAFDRLRAAAALAPDDPAVVRATARLLAAARACFDAELRGNRLARATACLDARRQLDDDADGLRADRRRLAVRWIAIGDERLGAGELVVARRALAEAQALDPDAPGLKAYAQRVQMAVVAGD